MAAAAPATDRLGVTETRVHENLRSFLRGLLVATRHPFARLSSQTTITQSRRLEMTTITYSVPGMSCGHCRAAITAEVSALPGVDRVDVDLDAKLVVIGGEDLEDAELVAAIDEAGYEAVRA
jgi:copper chaperone